jgi:hypothetical protein
MPVRFTRLPRRIDRIGSESPETVRFFKAQLKRKLPAAPIFTEDGVQLWRRHKWARAVNAGVLAHNR